MNKFLNEFEEVWIDEIDDFPNFKIGDIVICQVDYAVVGGWETICRYKRGKEYKIISIDNNKMLIKSDTGRCHYFKIESDVFKKTPPPFQRIYIPMSKKVLVI